jgi:hypothetical protein
LNLRTQKNLSTIILHFRKKMRKIFQEKVGTASKDAKDAASW